MSSPEQKVLSLEELERRVQHECAKAVFWQREVPLTVIGGSLAYAAIRSGLYKPRFAFGLHLIGINVLAYIVGKVTLRPDCERKMMAQTLNTETGRLVQMRRGHPEADAGHVVNDNNNNASNNTAAMPDFTERVIPAADSGSVQQNERPRRRRLNKYGDEISED
jgi:hypothetical protein